MKYHVSSVTELMDTLNAEKHKASCIPNSVLFLYQISFPSDLFFLVISNFKVYFLCALVFGLAVDFTRSLFPHYYQEAIT